MANTSVSRRLGGTTAASAAAEHQAAAAPLEGENTQGGREPQPSHGKVFLEALRLLLEARRRLGIAGIAALVGFATCVHASVNKWSFTELTGILVALTVFALFMIGLRWVEDKLKPSPRA